MKINFTAPHQNDIKELMYIEDSGFTPDEAATEEAMLERIEIIADSFIVAKDEQDNILGYVVGPVIHQRYITDELFEHTIPNPSSAGFQSILSLAVHPDHRGKGIAVELLNELEKVCVSHQRQGISLTCLDYLVPFYEANGYCNEGKSASAHAGNVWFNLVKDLE
ncbi:GNAT family N-acetyltransferase [Terribacillus saccharophilus]|uniref:GNAT family N-acetyltransferase n=1 Tax=Terribacillus saccharophilus TaxID=361277 RepID=A0ABX4GWI0_9BACI|nr:GNAT family N-acetyltransferase [Terribacillus saccharophilus]PAD34893.1 GNAT family N-acetyltransferase [Terribacillus saccharophilus]PAD95642.1 GNAT family N-acetyltransferase [Terribacillus saccharophilus]PAD99219.1 GNAT family N-acetyltransferase [Terribacillus saccharophilus]